jgi:hypothetical protein
MFLELIAQASLDAGRTVRILVPETHYLKCLILEVM